jgi:hypothetical protein
MISNRHKNNPITNEAAQLIRLGASGQKDFDTESAALCTTVDSDT